MLKKDASLTHGTMPFQYNGNGRKLADTEETLADIRRTQTVNELELWQNAILVCLATTFHLIDVLFNCCKSLAS